MISIVGVAVAGVGGYQVFDRFAGPHPAAPKTQIEKQVEGKAEKPAGKVASPSTLTKTPSAEKPAQKQSADLAQKIRPSFDIVRVEKSGETLVAGKAAPSTEVSLLRNGIVIGKAKTDASGAFVILPDKPLASGDSVLTLSAKTAKAAIASTQQVAVALAPDSEPLVAVLEEGKSVALLQRPVADAPVKKPDVKKEATAQPKQPNKVVELASLEIAVLAPPPIPSAPEPIVAVNEIVAKPLLTPAPSIKTEPKKTVLSARLTPVEKSQAAAVEKAAPSTERATAKLPVKSEAKLARVELAKEEIPKSAVSVEAVEVENQKLFIAGAAKPKETVRIYVDEEAVGDVKTADSGRWLLEKKKALKPGRYAIRADQVKSQTGEVVARAEVPFVIEQKALADLQNDTERTVIIRKSDNLWTIARRLYGDGSRFTAIYENNRDQIRNPSLIFPGQVFQLPAGKDGQQSTVADETPTKVAN